MCFVFCSIAEGEPHSQTYFTLDDSGNQNAFICTYVSPPWVDSTWKKKNLKKNSLIVVFHSIRNRAQSHLAKIQFNISVRKGSLLATDGFHEFIHTKSLKKKTNNEDETGRSMSSYGHPPTPTTASTYNQKHPADAISFGFGILL